jgi:hypothetical protein
MTDMVSEAYAGSRRSITCCERRGGAKSFKNAFAVSAETLLRQFLSETPLNVAEGFSDDEEDMVMLRGDLAFRRSRGGAMTWAPLPAVKGRCFGGVGGTFWVILNFSARPTRLAT